MIRLKLSAESGNAAGFITVLFPQNNDIFFRLANRRNRRRGNGITLTLRCLRAVEERNTLLHFSQCLALVENQLRLPRCDAVALYVSFVPTKQAFS